ncbi:heat-inducible transcriptional repressor HrcA [uncultured Clostridium sp.]|uniref:heat-inducible transcriptional repressor HrcA n=1 Tax=uncultured Clostridium sp. TaxID=59620 RepID=UPI002611E05A|nr:heat-inducible transcriptional repressor HrcA [uncultured Clostridium sp.]
MIIDDRKIKILQAIINDYINTGEPVGSRTIAKKYDLGVGPATIRNEMADLEELGLLEQPHTSAGRIPSSKGYRMYVDSMMGNSILSKEEELRIKEYVIDSAMLEVSKIVKNASTLLSELTNLTCVVKTPSMNMCRVKAIQLMKVDMDNLLFVVITNSEMIKNHLIKIKKMPLSEDINSLNKLLNQRLKDLTIDEINLEVINNLKNDLEGHEELFNAILPTLYTCLKEEDSKEVFMEGTTNIFNYPEYNDVQKVKEILSLLHDKECVLELIEPQKDITIKIGEENFIPEAKECSIISAEYSLGDGAKGTIGLIGPRRINYSKVVAIMAQVMKELNKTLRGDLDK